jgi:hypothetical protein
MTRASGELERVQQALNGLVLGPQRVLTRRGAQAFRRGEGRVLIQAGDHGELPRKVER